MLFRNTGEILGTWQDLLPLEIGEHLVEITVLVLDLVVFFTVVDVAGVDELEPVEKEVDTLRVVAVDLAVDTVLSNPNAGAFVVLVKSCDDGAVVVVDEGLGAFLDVLLDVDLVDAT